MTRIDVDHVLEDLTRAEQAMTWRDFAACKGLTHLFFPRRAERPEARARREAKARSRCMICPVAEACRAYARDQHEYGFWGGESEETRHMLGYTVSAPIGVRTHAIDPAV